MGEEEDITLLWPELMGRGKDTGDRKKRENTRMKLRVGEAMILTVGIIAQHKIDDSSTMMMKTYRVTHHVIP